MANDKWRMANGEWRMANGEWGWLEACNVSGVGQPTIYEWEIMVSATALTSSPRKARGRSDRDSSKWGLSRRFGNGGAAVQRSTLVGINPFVRESVIQLGGGLRAAAKTFVGVT
jgi:hypothetical protein